MTRYFDTLFVLLLQKLEFYTQKNGATIGLKLFSSWN